MSINSTIKNIRITRGVSHAEVAYKLNLNIDEVKNFEEEGRAISGGMLLHLLNVYESSVDELIKMKK